MKPALLLMLLGAAPIVTQEPAGAIEVARGGTAHAILAFRLAEGFHIQANPASNELLVPATLTLEKACGVRPAKPVYPAPVAFRLEGADQDLAVFEKELAISVLVKAGRFARMGECLLRGSLEYQACDEHTCLPPTTIEVVLPVRVLDA